MAFRFTSVPVFADLDKRASEVLTKEFPSEKEEKKFAWKGQTFNGVTLESTLTQKKDGSVFGTFAPKYTYKPYKTTFSAEFNTKREAKVEAKAEDLAGVVGLSSTLTLQQQAAFKPADPQQLYVTDAVEYRHENAALTASVDFGKNEGSTVKASAVVGSQGVLLGTSVTYHAGVSELKELNATLAYATLDYDLNLYGKLKNNDGKQDSEVGVSYFHAVTKDVSVGADISTDLNNTSKTPKVTFASSWRPDTSSTLKTKMDTEGKFGLSYGQKLNANTKLVVSTTVDANNLSGKNGSTFGASLNFTY